MGGTAHSQQPPREAFPVSGNSPPEATEHFPLPFSVGTPQQWLTAMWQQAYPGLSLVQSLLNDESLIPLASAAKFPLIDNGFSTDVESGTSTTPLRINRRELC